MGKLNEAESAARRYLETHQTSPDAHYLLGYILFREGNPKPSLDEYTEGARYRTPNALDLEAIGGDYFLMEDYAAADRWLTNRSSWLPSDAYARFYLGRAKYNLKHLRRLPGSLKSAWIGSKNVKRRIIWASPMKR